MTEFRTVVADPPWSYRDPTNFAHGGSWNRTRQGAARTPVAEIDAERKYGALALDDICSIPVERFVAEDAYLWLWVPSEQFLNGQHLAVCEAWGFRPKGWRVWVKNTPGVGLWLRYAHEAVVLAVRGSVEPLAPLGMSSVLEAPNKGHSIKPDAFFREVEDLCPGPFLELFARRPRPEQLDLVRPRVDWTVWGNEVGDPLGIGFDPEGWQEKEEAG